MSNGHGSSDGRGRATGTAPDAGRCASAPATRARATGSPRCGGPRPRPPRPRRRRPPRPTTRTPARFSAPSARRTAGRRRRGEGGAARASSRWCRGRLQSYYGRPVLKPPAWERRDRLLLLPGWARGGVLAAGGRRGPDGPAEPCAAVPASVPSARSLGGTYYLIKDLGRPERFHHMLRVAKPTSPMSVGTWILAGYGLPMGVAAVSGADAGGAAPHPARPAARRARPACRPGGRRHRARGGELHGGAAARRPPCRRGTRRTKSCRSSSRRPPPPAPEAWAWSSPRSSQASPARRLATYGAIVELAASRRLENRFGLLAEPFTAGATATWSGRAP